MATVNPHKAEAESMLNRAAAREPVLLGTAIVNFVAVLISGAAIFGLELSDAQQDMIWQMLIAFSGLIWAAAPFVRHSVYSPNTHANEVAAAAATSVPVVSEATVVPEPPPTVIVKENE
jgi:hypothetical protein